MIITLTLCFLVAVNFLLLIFSCNKTTKKGKIEKPTIIKVASTEFSNKKTTISTKQIARTQTQLAPTGS
jgi:hypothetical protein